MDELSAWITLHELVLHKPQVGALLLKRFDCPRRILTSARSELGATDPEWTLVTQLRRYADEQSVAALQQRCCTMGITIVQQNHSSYPRLLREIPDPPLVLFVRGDVGVLHRELQLAVVGTRKASAYGREVTTTWVDTLCAHDMVIVSGLAFGIDAAAHRAALHAQQPTVAVLASGVDLITPRTHRELGEEIVHRGGALVSEYPPGTESQAHHYPQRNRIISGLSLGALIVECAEASGTMWTARHCMEQGRLLFAVPGSVYHPLSAGPHRLIREGGIAVRQAGDIIEGLATSVGHNIIRREAKTGQGFVSGAMGPHLLERLDVPRTISELALLSGESVATILTRMTTLEMEGAVQRTASGHYCTQPKRGHA